MSIQDETDWTIRNGRTNSSKEFAELVEFVAELLDNSAHGLMQGHSGRLMVARLIMAQLAHVKGLHP